MSVLHLLMIPDMSIQHTARSMIPSTIPATSTHCPAAIFRYFTNAFTSTVNPIKPKITDGIPATRSIKARQTDASFFGMKKVRKQAHATPNIIANSTAGPDTYKVPVTAEREPYCPSRTYGRHSDDGRNILILLLLMPEYFPSKCVSA